jgi:hypothetical protein
MSSNAGLTDMFPLQSVSALLEGNSTRGQIITWKKLVKLLLAFILTLLVQYRSPFLKQGILAVELTVVESEKLTMKKICVLRFKTDIIHI